MSNCFRKRGVGHTSDNFPRYQRNEASQSPFTKGGYRYSIPQETSEDVIAKLEKILKAAFVSVDRMDKFVILRTLPGNASALANLIDKQYAKELFGTLNDDDNVLMITKTEADAETLFKDFQRFM